MDTPSLSARRLTPEILDALPPLHPDAARARRELQRLNLLLGHVGILRKALASLPPPQTIADLGGGDGRFLLRLISAMPGWRGGEIHLIDRMGEIDESTRRELAALGYSVHVAKEDAYAWLQSGDFPIDFLLANLFLHHFEGDLLQDLLKAIAARGRCFAAAEPRRSPFALFSCRLLPLIGCGEVVRFDARVSVEAGFTGEELSAMWPREKGFSLWEGRAGLWSHRFIARRDAPCTASRQ